MKPAEGKRIFVIWSFTLMTDMCRDTPLKGLQVEGGRKDSSRKQIPGLTCAMHEHALTEAQPGKRKLHKIRVRVSRVAGWARSPHKRRHALREFRRTVIMKIAIV